MNHVYVAMLPESQLEVNLISQEPADMNPWLLKIDGRTVFELADFNRERLKNRLSKLVEEHREMGNDLLASKLEKMAIYRVSYNLDVSLDN